MRSKRHVESLPAAAVETLEPGRPGDLPMAIYETLREMREELRKLSGNEEMSALSQPFGIPIFNGVAGVVTQHYGQPVKYIAVTKTTVALTISAGIDGGKPIATIPANNQGIVTIPPHRDISFSWPAPGADSIILGVVSSHQLAAFVHA